MQFSSANNTTICPPPFCNHHLMGRLLRSSLVALVSATAAAASGQTMGWSSHGTFGCAADCAPNASLCVSDTMYRGVVQSLHAATLIDAGYTWLYVDDCWSEHTRDTFGRLVPDASRFPQGLSGLAAYAHEHKMHLAVSIDLGPTTCAGHPGSWGHFGLDIQTLASWGVDRVIIQSCSALPSPSTFYFMLSTLTSLAHAATLSTHCLLGDHVSVINATLAAAADCDFLQLAPRLHDDWIEVSHALLTLDPASSLSSTASLGPLVVGGYGLTHGQAKLQLATWQLLAFPLLVAVDIQSMITRSPADHELLVHPVFLQLYHAPRTSRPRRWVPQDNVLVATGVTVWLQNLTWAGHAAMSITALRPHNLPPHMPISFDLAWDELNLPSSAECDVVDVWMTSSSLRVKHRVTVTVAPFDAAVLVVIPTHTML
ncbi:Aste57867_9041 [Aphanomyces stellatus]|uniref:Alpha-galactosidase n=1 Tax=Aphanomyces stellatus TaxID=120398 RepID=A0A485KM79_9STRA|nr:hypothetical protein As57867_009005 [Aphanomyces stellatus]VFT85925.1 Aste57867_9041 [Aphanomyces stellatus]